MTAPLSQEPVVLDTLVEKFRKAMDFVGRRMINREKVIRQAFYALLTGDHQLLQSRTGAGKTMLAEQIFAMFDQVRIFRVQASKEQMPDTYFGALDIEQLKRGRIVHNTADSLVESEFGFIDEIFDANDYTLRALLSLLNERALVRGAQYMPAKVHTVIAATNYLRVTEVTEAILDRFVYKAMVLPDKDPFIQYKIAQQYAKYSGRIAPPSEKIPFSELQLAYRIVTNQHPALQIAIYPEHLYFMNLVIRHYEFTRNRMLRHQKAERDFYISPRTQAKAQDLLRAVAFLEGRQKVTVDDIAQLKYIFTTIGVEEEEEAFMKSFETLYRSMMADRGFEQLRVLLDFADVLEQLKYQPERWHQPLHTLENVPIRRTVLEWLKDTLSGGESPIEHNQRVLKKFLQDFVPVNEEMRELKQHLLEELQRVIQLAPRS